MINGINKKASIQLSTETVVKVVLTVFLLLALFYVSGKLLGVFITDKDESTIRNFEQLTATIAQMKEGASLENYPIYISEDYAVAGYKSGVDETETQGAIGGSCTPYDITSPYFNKKPEKCGVGEEGCLCLCEKTDEFATLCQENDKVLMCKTTDYFGEDLSFAGGFYSDGSGQCTFALLYGSEQPQTIYVKKGEDDVRICQKECDSSDAVARSSTEKSDISSPSSSERSADEEKSLGTSVLIIGDSQTMGPYGDELYSSFKNDGNTVNMYAVCGATPSYFTKGSSIPSCDAEFTYDDGTSDYVTSGNIPLVDNLITAHNPSLVFITFASNMYDSSETTIESSVETLAQEITSSNIACYWAGPPQGPRYSSLEDYQTFKEIMKQSVEQAGCTFIDSEEYTSFNFCSDAPFGCDADPHFANHGAEGKAAAQEWAVGIYADFRALVE